MIVIPPGPPFQFNGVKIVNRGISKTVHVYTNCFCERADKRESGGNWSPPTFGRRRPLGSHQLHLTFLPLNTFLSLNFQHNCIVMMTKKALLKHNCKTCKNFNRSTTLKLWQNAERNFELLMVGAPNIVYLRIAYQ